MLNLNLRFNRKHLATYILVALTAVVWGVQVVTFGGNVSDGQNLLNAGALWGYQILQNPTELWRLFTPIFLHLSWSHFLLNMLTLFLVGRLIEEIFGSIRFTAIYLLSGIFANAATFFLTTSTLSAGASTSIFGIFGAIAVLGFFTGDPRLRIIGQSFVALIVINLLFNFFQSDVNIAGHIGGVAGGALLAAIFPPAAYKRFIPDYIRYLSLFTFIILFVLFILMTFAR